MARRTAFGARPRASRNPQYVAILVEKRPAFDAGALRKEMEESLSKEDISYLIDIGLSKGNNIEAILKQLNHNDANKFEDIANRIGLHKKQDANQPKLSVQERIKLHGSRPTLSRICNAFPEITCDFLLESPTKGPVSLATCVEASGYKEFPTIARHQAYSTLIPEDFNFRAEALEVIMLPNMLFSERIQKDEWRNMSVREKFRDTFNFLDKSFHSPVIKEDDRWELARKYGILTENNDLSDVWLAAAGSAGKFLMDNFKCGLEASGKTMVDIVEKK